MVTMGTLPNRQSDLALVGAVPAELDGLLLLPSQPTASQELSLNALRLGAGRSLWYASVAQLSGQGVVNGLLSPQLTGPRTVGDGASFRRTLTSAADALHLSARRDSENALEWALHDEHGSEREVGQIGVERAREIADLFVTESCLLVLSVVQRDAVPCYQVGVAPRRSRARVHWLAEERAGWPELLHAREEAGIVRLELAVRSERAASAARIVRGTINARALLFATESVLDFALAFPSVFVEGSSARNKARAFLCGISAERLEGDKAPALIKLDLRTGTLETRGFGFGRELGSPALALGRAPEGEPARSFVLLPVYDAVRDWTDCCVLDTDSLGAAPCAVIRLPPVRSNQKTHWIGAHRARQLDTALAAIAGSLR
jgi:hypothetical protein